jgi:hypothetical protein
MHPLAGHFTGLLGGFTSSQPFDDQEAPADADDFFADSGRPGSSCGVVHVEAGTDDGRIANPSGEFVSQATGGACAPQVSFGIQGEHGDSVVAVGSERDVTGAIAAGFRIG